MWRLSVPALVNQGLVCCLFLGTVTVAQQTEADNAPQRQPAQNKKNASDSITHRELDQLLKEFRQEQRRLKAENEALRQELTNVKQGLKGVQQTGRDADLELVLSKQALLLDEIQSELATRTDPLLPGVSNVLLSGFAFGGFTDQENADSSFSAGVSPVILWKMSDRLLFETELEFGLEGEGTEVELGYAHISYLLNDYFTLGAGKFLTPFGTFGERLHPTWINKLPDAPLGLSHHNGIVPMASVGLQLRGGAPVGRSKINYALYFANGPKLNTGEEEGDHEAHGGEDSTGTLNFNNFDDINNNKAIGGRFGFLPFPDLELGYSFQYGDVGSSGTPFRDVDALLQAADLSYIHDSRLLKGRFDARVQWVWSEVDYAHYNGEAAPLMAGQEGDDHGDEGDGHDDGTGDDHMDDGTGAGQGDDGHGDEEHGMSGFNNRRNGGYFQLAYRPTKVDNEFLKDLEFVLRYGMLESPNGFDQQRWTLGLNYWLGPSTVIKTAYQYSDKDGGGEDDDAFLIQFATGF